MKTVFRIVSLALFAAIALCVGAASLYAAPAASSPNATTAAASIIVWTYDSFASKWGPGPVLAKTFKAKTGIDVVFVAKGDGGALLASLLAEGPKARADIVIGLDNSQVSRALKSGLFEACQTQILAKALANIPQALQIDPSNRLLPFDFGHFAFIWDSQSKTPAPKSLEDLTKADYAKKIIIMDPRTSTVGAGFLTWIQAVYGDQWQDYLKRLAPSLLAMTPGWDVGYGLFTAGEAPLVLSYATSPAYHKLYDNTERYKALLFEQGHPVQIELAGLLGAARNKKESQAFLEFLLSPEGQMSLPETQFMYPANSALSLPESYAVAPKPGRILKAALRDPVADPSRMAEILAAAAKK